MNRLEFFKETNIIFREHTQVFHAELQVGYAFYAHTESEARINLAVDAASVKHIGIDHSAAQYFHPSGVLAEVAALAAAQVARNVHFGRRLGEWEIAWAQAHLCVGAEHFPCEI